MGTEHTYSVQIEINELTRVTDLSQAVNFNLPVSEAINSIVKEWVELKNGQEPQDNESTFDSDALVEKLEHLTAQSQQLYEDTSELYQRMSNQFPPF